MRTKEQFDEVIDELNIKSDEKFREDTFQPEQIKSTVEKLKKDIRKIAINYMKEN